MNKIKAGRFSTFLKNIIDAQKNDMGSDVPCGKCTACCQSSYFIPIAPHEKDTLKRIPKDIVFKAPGLSDGHVLLGYDEKGKCPMLIDEKCSIYENRPMTCRNYDCRVFPATGYDADDEDSKALISKQIKKWEFTFESGLDNSLFESVQNAARFLDDEAGQFPYDFLPKNNTQLAIFAIKISHLFHSDNDHYIENEALVLEIIKEK